MIFNSMSFYDSSAVSYEILEKAEHSEDFIQSLEKILELWIRGEPASLNIDVLFKLIGIIENNQNFNKYDFKNLIKEFITYWIKEEKIENVPLKRIEAFLISLHLLTLGGQWPNLPDYLQDIYRDIIENAGMNYSTEFWDHE